MFPERTDLPRAQVRWRLGFIAPAVLMIAMRDRELYGRGFPVESTGGSKHFA